MPYIEVSTVWPHCPNCGAAFKGPMSFDSEELTATCLDCGHKAEKADWLKEPSDDGITDMTAD